MKKAILLLSAAVALTVASCEMDDLGFNDFLNDMNIHTDVDIDGDSDTDSDADGDGDGDTDADTDIDADADTDCDADADMDADTDTDVDFTGVDLLLVVDNSASMSEEQNTLATSIYTLLNALVRPVQNSLFAPVENVRVAVVSSDMGLQYGENGSTVGIPDISTCESVGDDGVFQSDLPGTVTIASNTIACDPSGAQCPNSDWTCLDGFCAAPEDNQTVACAPLTDNSWSETTSETPNADIVNNLSCMAELGTGGCGIEQPLQAGVKAVTRWTQRDFLQNDHVLAVVVVSDEEDCSIEDSGLFATAEWESHSLINIACNYPESNETNYLFDAEHFHSDLIAAKDGREDAVVFAAVVGVPNADASCQGAGDQIGGCLDNPTMELVPQEFTDPASGTSYTHFRPACTRQNNEGVDITVARPGRRFVETAQQFGSAGYVTSICNADWSPAMTNIAEMISNRINAVK